ncbi:MAG TPA: ATP-binding cassette domain-containing protein [Burkholderiales bacterium]|nr:ATP-binding cassette domain-containing protein [Burkholderiales bacterium]
MMPDPSLLLKAHGLQLSYGGHVAVENVSLELKRGEVLGFLGPNGAGKSSTMRMITGNLKPDSGKVSICGIDLYEKPLEAKAKLGYLPEVPPLYREMRVDDYLKFAAKLHGAKDIGMVKERCGLVEVGKRLVGSLSKGYQQRLGIAQAIVHDPEIVVLDEPTSGLDPNQIREIRALIREIGDRHGVILSTHILSEVESICDRVEILHHGKQVYSGKIEEGGGAIEVGFRSPPSIDEISGIEGIENIQTPSSGLFLIHPVEGFDPTDSLILIAQERNWGLQRINPAKNSLEAFFAELTKEAS